MPKISHLLPLAAAAMLTCLPAQAALTTMNFDTAVDTSFAPFAPLLGSDDFLIQGDYYVGTVSTKATAQPGDLVGALVDGSDVVNTCLGLICPGNNATQFLAMVNDGLPYFARLDQAEFKVSYFDAAFIANSGVVVPPVSLLLRVFGIAANLDVYAEDFLLPGPVGGAYTFARYHFSSEFSNRDFIEVDFYGYACDAQGSCNRSSNQAQFALDNVTFGVPEPAGYGLAFVALAAAGLATRRRKPLA